MSNQNDKDEAKERVWHEFLTLPYGDGIGSSYKQAMNMAFEAGIAYHAAAELRWIPVSERLPSIEDAKQWKSEQTGAFISPELEDYVAKLMSDYAMEVLARSGYFDGRDYKGE